MATSSDSSASRQPPITVPPGGKSATLKAKPNKPAFVKLCFLAASPLELSLRYALIQLEIAGEPNYDINDFMNEILRKELTHLAKTGKVNFSAMANGPTATNQSPKPAAPTPGTPADDPVQ